MQLYEVLIAWYKQNKRDLVFRKSKDPYKIWVSEIMAQQTRIDSMLPYFERWIAKWPSVEDLAQASLEEILFAWQGLGYYNRARKLHAGAKFVCEKYSGQLPANVEQLKEIPGIGAYTAGAIGSIAFGLRAPAIDGNVLRVTTRMMKIKEDITKKSTMEKVYDHIYTWMSNCDTSAFTQGLMEIGSLICLPKKPQCMLCPLNAFCLSFADGTQLNYPIKKAAKPPLELQMHTYYITNSKQEILLSEDWSDGLMKGILRLPQYTEMSLDLMEAKAVEKRRFVFSHRVWNMQCYKLHAEIMPLPYTFWVKESELNQMTLVTAHRKWLTEMGVLK